MSVSLESFTAEHFESSIDGVFRLETNDTTLDLRLAAVTRFGRAQRQGGAFSLLFVSEPGPFLRQAIYPLTNEALGTLEIFVVPIGPVDGGNGYEAVFT